MNRTDINAFRVSHGLAPIVDTADVIEARRRKQKNAAANKAAHAALQREIRSNRNRNRKG